MKFIFGWKDFAREVFCLLEENQKQLNKRMDEIMATLADLEAKSTELQGAITDLKNNQLESRAAVDGLIAKVQELKDLVASGGSTAQITALLSSMDSSIAEINAIAANEEDEEGRANNAKA